jgi:outer membrane protein assembly factor BamB
VTWAYPTNCPIDHSAAIAADGTLYVGCADGDLLALAKPQTGNRGELRWRWVHHGVHGALSWPAVGADGTVFFGANDRNLHAVSPPETGTVAVEKWAFQTQGPVDSSPAIGPDGTIYVGTADRYLYAIE